MDMNGWMLFTTAMPFFAMLGKGLCLDVKFDEGQSHCM